MGTNIIISHFMLRKIWDNLDFFTCVQNLYRFWSEICTAQTSVKYFIFPMNFLWKRRYHFWKRSPNIHFKLPHFKNQTLKGGLVKMRSEVVALFFMSFLNTKCRVYFFLWGVSLWKRQGHDAAWMILFLMDFLWIWKREDQFCKCPKIRWKLPLRIKPAVKVDYVAIVDIPDLRTLLRYLRGKAQVPSAKASKYVGVLQNICKSRLLNPYRYPPQCAKRVIL